MPHDPEQILAVLDACCDAYTFPMLDNGYVYLAASRLSLHHSASDWALVIEIFGYSPRAGSPDIHVHTFASRLQARNPRERYVNENAYKLYLMNNPNNESHFFYPIDGEWQDENNNELVSDHVTHILLRGRPVPLPALPEYAAHGINLEYSPRVQVFELCRFLADTEREHILATPAERWTSILPEMQQILQLEEWHHPDLIANERPSTSAAFQQLARVLAFGDASQYKPSEPPNTHWSNWPEGGTL
jgi:hypothetical protein